jgi:L-seryl-tRNA(Ser) seleniumtransferase
LADAFAQNLPPAYAVEVVECMSQIGSGALPVHLLCSAGVRIRSTGRPRNRDRDIQLLQRVLRALQLPIIGRIDDHALLLDCRCLTDVDELVPGIEGIANALAAAGGERDADPTLVT